MENNHNKSYSFIDSNLSKDSQIYDLDPIFPKGYKTVRKESKDILTDIPLQTACEVLFEKGIITNGSRANNESTEVYYIAIDIDSLSDNNKKILYTIQQKEDKLYKKYGKPGNHNFLVDKEEYNIQPGIIMEAYIPDRRRDEKGNVERKHGNIITDVEAYFLSKVDLFEDQCEKKNGIIKAIKQILTKYYNSHQLSHLIHPLYKLSSRNGSIHFIEIRGYQISCFDCFISIALSSRL